MAAEKTDVVNGSPGPARTVLLGDTHPLFRAGMRHMLQEALAPAEVVEAGSRSELLALLERGSFDLVLTCLFSVEGDWEHFLPDLLQRAPPGRLMILSVVDEPTKIRRLLAAGAAGFVLKETPPSITLHAIRLVLDGGIYIPPAALQDLPGGSVQGVEVLAGATSSPPPAMPVAAPAGDIPLTDRQQAVLQLILQGASNKGIARALDLSAGTVKGHVANLLRLYGAENRMDLVRAASGHGTLPMVGPKGSEPRRPR